MDINEAARQLGRKGGSARSERKAKSSRDNFAKAREAKRIKSEKTKKGGE